VSRQRSEPPAALEVEALDVEALARRELAAEAPDHWLASRLVVDPGSRLRLVGLYWLDLELSRAGRVATPLAGEIRLAWWREAIETAAAGGGSSPMSLTALGAISPRLAAALAALVEGRHADLEPRPFEDESALEAYLDAVDGSLLTSGCEILAAGSPVALTATARTVGLARLLRRHPDVRSDWRPKSWGAEDRALDARRVAERLEAWRPAVRQEMRSLPTAAFPAAASATLSSLYARGRRPGGLEKRVRLLLAAVRGVV
jgi:phytoene synthase